MQSSVTRSGLGGPAPLRGLSFWLLATIIILSPLPLAGARPIWDSLLTVIVAVALLAHVWHRARARRPVTGFPAVLIAAGTLVVGVAVWGGVQATPGLVAPDWVHPAWIMAAQTLGTGDLPAAISVAPEQSVRTAITFLTYVAFGGLVALHCRREKNATLLLTLFMLAQGAYAIYGLTMHLSGLEMVLWYDKDAYRGSVTSTFINRNSYATYVGLGLLATLTLTLRYVRRVAQSDLSPRGKVLEFASGVWGHVVVPVLVLSVGTIALLLTGSRMGLAAFTTAALVFLVVWLARLRGRQRWVGYGLLALVLIVMAGNFALSGDTTMARFDALFERGDGRFTAYPLVLQAIEDRPWLGHGLGTFETAFRLYRDESVGVFFTRAHSDYLELAMGAGLPGAVAMVLAFAVLGVAGMIAALRRTEFERPLLAVAALVLVAVHATVDFSLQIPAVALAVVLLVANGLAVRAPEQPKADPSDVDRSQ